LDGPPLARLAFSTSSSAAAYSSIVRMCRSFKRLSALISSGTVSLESSSIEHRLEQMEWPRVGPALHRGPLSISMSDADEPEARLDDEQEFEDDDEDHDDGEETPSGRQSFARLTKYAMLLAYCGAGYQGFQM
jgi:hypothetical protein